MKTTKNVNLIVQNWYAFKRFAEAVLDQRLSEEDLIELLMQNPAPDQGFFIKKLDNWTLGRKIIAGLKSAISVHGPITLTNINSAAKRIVGKVTESVKCSG